MAQIPTPRSYSEILGDMIDAFLSRYGLRALKVGSPVLSMLESTAQSQLRSSEDIFTLLDAISLDQAKGLALDRIGADESTPRNTETPASGVVTFTDTSFAKVSTKIYQGLPAPIVGSVSINVTDASGMPSVFPFNIYIGRGITNFEGPLAVTAKVNNGPYWTLTLSTGTQKFHNLGEAVTLAQGGDRVLNAGTIVQTPQGNVVNAVQYRTLYKATIPDGETSISGVTVVALKPGVTGNTIAGGINSFNGTAPFAGATVSNPAPFTNGLATETDDMYRERIRQARASRVRGTALALETFSIGVTSASENKRVLTSSVVSHLGSPTALYIDDGTGYEMSSTGVAIESLIDSALGGETYAKISAPRPVTKAFLLSSQVAPFALSSGMQWAFTVGGVTTVHTVANDGTFRAIGAATGYEWVASVNANPNLNWSARTVAGGTQVAVFAKADTNEAIQYAPGSVTNDGNVATGFALRRVDTMALYKNDRLLSKDGQLAVVTSNSVALWGTFGASEDLQISVDGTSLSNLVGGTFTFTAQDFINAQTGFTTLGTNTAAAWAAVLDYRIPGITATVVNGLIVLTSNLGPSSGAQINITGGSLVTKGMFAATNVFGRNSDYTLDRNTGEIKLAKPLVAGDHLGAGSTQTRAFLQTPALGALTIPTGGAHLWFAADGNASIITHGVTAATPLDFSTTAEAWGVRQRITSHAGAALFANVQVGDWVMFWDANAPSDLKYNSYRVAAVDTAFTWFEIERSSVVAPANPVTFVNAGISFARATSLLQAVSLAAASNYTASSIAAAFDTTFVGLNATVYNTTAMRVNTNTFSATTGDVAMVGADANGLLLGLAPANATKNITGHLASVESANSEMGTPDFQQTWVTTAAGLNVQPQVDRTPDGVFGAPSTGLQLVGLRPVPDGKTLALTRYGYVNGRNSTLSAIASAGGNLYNLTLRNLPGETHQHGRWYFASPYRIASDDSLTWLVDGDTNSKRFTIPMWRTLKTQGTTYAATNTFKDADNGNQSLAIGFGAGTGFDFNDWAVYMPARTKSDSASLTKAILWRYYRLGPDGNFARVQYQNPTVASQPVSYTVDNINGGPQTNIGIVLSSGAERTGYTIRSSTYLGQAATGLASGLGTFMFVLGLLMSSVTVTGGNLTTATLTLPTGITDHGLQIGDIVWVNSTSGFVASGAKTITARTASTIAWASTDTNGTYANAGDVSKDANGRATLTGGNQVTGDFFYLGPGFSSRLFTQSMYTTYNLSQWSGNAPYSGATSSTLSWVQIGDVTQFHLISNPAQTSSALVTSFNAAIAGDTKCPIKSATLVSDGTGVIDRSSDETAAASPTWFSLSDGLNHVQTTTVPGTIAGDYQLTFKDAITASLATNSDWANETVKIVPRTAKNIVDWYNAPTVSGLFSVADIERSSNGHKVQIASLTPGSTGSVQAQGGTANAMTVPVVGNSLLTSNNLQMVVNVPTSQIAGIQAQSWVSIDNTGTQPRPSVFGATTTLQALTNVGSTSLLQFSNASLYSLRGAATASAIMSIEQQGKFWAITDSTLGAAMGGIPIEGDWVRIYQPSPTVYVGVAGNEAVSLVSSANVGIFRCVRVVASPDVGGITFWIENPSGVAQPLAELSFMALTSQSVVPGDILKISTPLFDGAKSNQGAYVVTDVGNNGAGSYTSNQYLTVSSVMSPVGAPSAALGSNSPQVQIVEGKPGRFIKQVVSVTPNATDGTLTQIKFATAALYYDIGASLGSVITVLDKLGFSTSIAQGVDGYQHTTGLIAEVTKVIQGDPADDATYPGVAAAGASVNVLGPLVKRIQVTIAVRIRSGASATDIEARVKSAVAAVINKTGVGSAIALSDLVNAATKVGGVVSAVMVSPVATSGTDLISVQPYEKPLVLNVDTDVQVSFIGT